MLWTYMPNLVLLAQVVWAQRCQKAMGIQGFKKILAFFKYLKIFFCTFRLASVLKPWGYVYIHTEVWFPLLASAFLVFFEKYQRFKKRNKICKQFFGFFSRFGKNRAQTLMPFFIQVNMDDWHLFGRFQAPGSKNSIFYQKNET